METENEKQLWRQAKKRVGFKRHLAVYLATNTLFWIIWAINDEKHEHYFPWPVWPMLGWGIGLTFDYLGAYVFTKYNTVEEEFEKLKREKGIN